MASSRFVEQSDIYSFISAPPATTSVNLPENISIVGNLGLDNNFNNNQAGKTVLAMQKFLSSSNIFIHTGDIACADLYGLVVDFKPYDDTWNTFQNNIQPISARGKKLIGHSRPFPSIPGHSHSFPAIPIHSHPFAAIPIHSRPFPFISTCKFSRKSRYYCLFNPSTTIENI